MGLNATEQEERDDILRAEIVVQRDGLPSGRALFKCSTETQQCTEFTREQRKEYDRVYGEQLDNSLKSSSNPDANIEKYNKSKEIYNER